MSASSATETALRALHADLLAMAASCQRGIDLNARFLGRREWAQQGVDQHTSAKNAYLDVVRHLLPEHFPSIFPAASPRENEGLGGAAPDAQPHAAMGLQLAADSLPECGEPRATDFGHAVVAAIGEDGEQTGARIDKRDDAADGIGHGAHHASANSETAA